MSIHFDYELKSDLTFVLDPDEKALIKINGVIASCVLNTTIDELGTYIVKSTLDSTEFIDLPTTTINNVSFEYIKVSGVTYEELTFSIPSLVFAAPSFLYIENTSPTEQQLKVSLRGNR